LGDDEYDPSSDGMDILVDSLAGKD